jgi:Choline-glycine betaine transporter
VEHRPYYRHQPYAIYTCAGLPFALALYNSKRLYKVSSSFYNLFGNRIKGGIGTVSDSLSMFNMSAARGKAAPATAWDWA